MPIGFWFMDTVHSKACQDVRQAQKITLAIPGGARQNFSGAGWNRRCAFETPKASFIPAQGLSGNSRIIFGKIIAEILPSVILARTLLRMILPPMILPSSRLSLTRLGKLRAFRVTALGSAVRSNPRIHFSVPLPAERLSLARREKAASYEFLPCDVRLSSDCGLRVRRPGSCFSSHSSDRQPPD